MRINLSGRNVRMAQHDLYAPQVRPAFHQVSGETVADYVRSQAAKNSNLTAISLQERPECLPGHRRSASRNEDVRAGAPLQQLRTRFPQIPVERFAGAFTE